MGVEAELGGQMDVPEKGDDVGLVLFQVIDEPSEVVAAVNRIVIV